MQDISKQIQKTAKRLVVSDVSLPNTVNNLLEEIQRLRQKLEEETKLRKELESEVVTLKTSLSQMEQQKEGEFNEIQKHFDGEIKEMYAKLNEVRQLIATNPNVVSPPIPQGGPPLLPNSITQEFKREIRTKSEASLPKYPTALSNISKDDLLDTYVFDTTPPSNQLMRTEKPISSSVTDWKPALPSSQPPSQPPSQPILKQEKQKEKEEKKAPSRSKSSIFGSLRKSKVIDLNFDST